MSEVKKVSSLDLNGISKIRSIALSSIARFGGCDIVLTPPIPVGAVMPFIGGTVPAGCALFSDADGRYLYGANGSNNGATGGAESLTWSMSLASSGAHLPAVHYSGYGWNWLSPKPSNHVSGGAHSHSIASHTDSYRPSSRDLILIKATQELPKLPANALALNATTTAFESLSQYANGDNKFLRANSALGNYTAPVSFTKSTNSEGSHNHATDHTFTNMSSCYSHSTTGAHSHSVLINISENLQRIYVTAWYHASQDVDLQNNMILMFDGDTIPDGWVLCDGTNGTKDLRSRFVFFNLLVNGGTILGNNKVALTANQSFSWSHTHQGGSDGCSGGDQKHASYNASHAHSGSTTLSYAPLWRTISFIQPNPNLF